MKYFAELSTEHIKGYLIFLDIDGTLTHERLSAIEAGTIQKVNELKKNNDVYLCSNSRDHRRNRKVADHTQVEYIKTNLRKPNRKILDLIKNPDKKPFMVIGDKFITDGLFARSIGGTFIKVRTVSTYRDGIFMTVVGLIDDLIYKLFA